MSQEILIVDDHDAFRGAVRALLEVADFAVVGEAGSGLAGVEAAVSLRPEVVLLDIQLPDLDGFAVASRLAALADPPQVVLISSRSAATYGARLAGHCFLAKHELTGAALRDVLR